VSSTSPEPGIDPIALGMQRHPEGGWYRETWRHERAISTPRGDRSLATCVAYLLEPGDRSAWHRVQSDELWLWQGGGPMLLTVGGDDDVPVAGFSVELREGGQYLVRASEWQTAEPATDHASLVACVVAPGFDFADLTLAR
jgi:predicted cupin superfamily sugar epimerase